ncbi:uncharacterized protein LOC135215942 [Macrobrachium nipponense]|uniref:uncharacterized protein LOC135215942 n=1 Tax=Macrobrachium nipponense TaxID=159736 RepID=UPI0030C7AB1D
MAEQIHQLEFMRSQFQEMVDAYENKTSEQEMEITYLRKEVQQKNNLLEEGIAQRDNLEKVIKEKEKEIEHFKREREDNLKEPQDLRIQIALRDKDLQKRDQDVQLLLEELENWQKESEELVRCKLRQEEFYESQFHEMEDAYEKKISEQEKEITCLCKEVQQKNNLLEEGIAQRDNLNKKLECVEMDNSHRNSWLRLS